MRIVHAIVVGIAGIALACASPGSLGEAGPEVADSAPVPSGTVIELPGTSWLVHSYTDPDGYTVGVMEGTTLTLAFDEENRVAGSAGCNGFNASFETDGSSISLGPTATTRKMCTGLIMKQESAFLARFATVRSWEIDGERLELFTGDGTLAVDLKVASVP